MGRRTAKTNLAVALAFVLLAGTAWADGGKLRPLKFEPRSIDGSQNNRQHPDWGQAGTPYLRVAPARYAGGADTPMSGPNPRYLSNRVFNDRGQNLFSENGVSQWVWTWGQFMDHTFGLAEGNGTSDPIQFNSVDPIEDFTNDLTVMSFKRDAAVPGTGINAGTPREQINTVSSYIDGSSIYGDSLDRLEWLRAGPVDGNLANNSAKLLLTPEGNLPAVTARGDASTAPEMALDGQLRLNPDDAVVAGDVRANENLALTSTHTLFAREHNRIVASLPARLSEERKFQIARRVVGAEQQYVTYNEFLPSVGAQLEPYRGYDPQVNATLGNEFATVAYRAHSMIHGEFELEVDADHYSQAELDAFEAAGIEVLAAGDEIELVVPLGLAFFNPKLVDSLGAGPALASLSAEAQYKNDEQIDNALRSVLFKTPGPNAPDPIACFSDPTATGCFQGVVDLGALDVQRGRDHGMPTYNAMRQAYGLPPVSSFREITGEASEAFPDDSRLGANPVNDPDSLDFISFADADGNPLPADTEEATTGVRRTPLAARLKTIYGSVENVEAFVGMVAESHLPGSEFGPLQNAAWVHQFEALRDGDRFFYARDRALREIKRRFGVTYRLPLSKLIALNTDVERNEIPANVFLAP